MPASGLELHPEALEDALSGYSWYLQHSEKVADLFFAELQRAVGLILEAPDRWPVYLNGTRRFPLSDYPYGVVYKQQEGIVFLYAVAHAKRRPGYWKARVGGTG